MTAEHQAVTDANEEFYRALTNRDMPAMERVWFPADWVECVHPGVGPIRGWEAVRDSWTQLFAADGTLLIAPTDVQVRLVGDVAWVSCDERIAARSDGRMVSSLAHATNVFVRHDGVWRLVTHHVSLVPFVPLPLPEDGTLVN
jgi:ketosteroid isomerase-like protein